MMRGQATETDDALAATPGRLGTELSCPNRRTWGMRLSDGLMGVVVGVDDGAAVSVVEAVSPSGGKGIPGCCRGPREKWRRGSGLLPAMRDPVSARLSPAEGSLATSTSPHDTTRGGEARRQASNK